MSGPRQVITACVLSVAVAAIPFGHNVAEASIAVSVRDYGAVGNGATDDTAAIQRAMNAVASAGGGRVSFPAGTYRVGGLFQASGVELVGNGDAILKSRDPLKSAIIYAKTKSTTGSIARGSKMLRVASLAGAQPGVPVAIRGAGQQISGQTTSSPYLYAKVVSILGQDLMIDRGALASVSDAIVWVGTTKTAIRGLTFDGNKGGITDPSATVPIDLRLTGGAILWNNTIKNGLHGAIRLDLGSRGNLIENNVLIDNGRPAQRLGAAVWLFRGASGNTIRNNRISGASYHGIALDDRTETATDWDGPSNWNVISNNMINIPATSLNSGLYIGGSSNNRIESNVVSDTVMGIAVETSTQGENGRIALRNALNDNVLSEHDIGLYVTGSQNSFNRHQISSTHARVVNTGSENTFTW